MKKLILLTLIMLWVYFVNAQTPERYPDSIRLERIDSTLREYGRQQTLANKITLVEIGAIAIGTIAGINPVILVGINTACDLATLLFTSRANKKLAEHKSN